MAREGDEVAIELCSFQPDPEALDLCRKIADSPPGQPGPWPGARDCAQETAPRLEAFAQGTWEAWIQKLLIEASWDHRHFHWALEVAQARRPGWLLKTLRARLTSEYRKRPDALDHTGGNGPEVDWVLFTLADCGGGIDERELAYLQRYGYACDPREWVIDACGLAPRLRQGRAMERALQKAKFTLADMLDWSVQEAGRGTAIAAKMTLDLHGSGRAYGWVAKDRATLVLDRSFDTWGSGRGPTPSDQSELAEALKISLKSAIETALRRERGVALEVRAYMTGDQTPEIEVRIFWAGQMRIVTVDGVRGVVRDSRDGGEFRWWGGP
ncbi:MAG TPA: hypothetical protein VEN81_06145 [Planctomycetota bacterium]|nr:hypothetical protein [Planctomycetota bacterium]